MTTTYVPETTATRIDAQNYFNMGMQELNGIIEGEERAKAAVLLATLLNSNFVLVGPAGGGKSSLAKDSWRILEDAYESPEAVVHLTGQHDVKAQQLIGGTLTTKNEVVNPKSPFIDFV